MGELWDCTAQHGNTLFRRFCFRRVDKGPELRGDLCCPPAVPSTQDFIMSSLVINPRSEVISCD